MVLLTRLPTRMPAGLAFFTKPGTRASMLANLPTRELALLLNLELGANPLRFEF